jgi:hypothetical protein
MSGVRESGTVGSIPIGKNALFCHTRIQRCHFLLIWNDVEIDATDAVMTTQCSPSARQKSFLRYLAAAEFAPWQKQRFESETQKEER